VFSAGYRAWRYDDRHHGEPRGLAVFAQTEQAPDPASRVHLVDERDALGMRRIALDWRLGDLDRRSIRAMTQCFASEFARLDLGRVQLSEWIREEDGGWSGSMGFGHHHCGTTRMAHSPRTGVVNSQCRLHEVENLYVAGSSVFPTNGFANPTFTIVALSLRLADHLQRVLT
jgi:choline dehydrogenase-like flavoprotein